jgi:GTPase SAR1 family protein
VKIALVGSPGAGKTELATQLLEKLPKSAVVDDYISQIEDRSEYGDDKRISTTMMWYGIFGFDTLDYDHIFYLPLSDEEKETNGRRWDTMVDEQIVEAAESLGVKVKTLPTDREARLGEVLQEVGVEAPASV